MAVTWKKLAFYEQIEPALGNPSADGFRLASTASGTRSWVDPFLLALPGSDHSAQGPQTSAHYAGESITAMELVYLGANGKWYRADADAASSCGGLLAIALESKSADQYIRVALPGSYVRDDSWSWTAGNTLYASTDIGVLTATQPSGTDDVIRVVGWAISGTVIFFHPSPDYTTHT